MALRPLLQLVLLAAVLWLVTRILRQGLLGRIGEVGKFGILAVIVGTYALYVVLAAMGGSARPLGDLQRLVTPGPLLIVVVTVFFLWLILRELPFPMPYRLGFILDSPLRRLFVPVDAVLRRMAVGPGMRVVEIGCGTGLLSVEVARRLGSKGVLFCIDIQPQMVEKTRQRFERSDMTETRDMTELSDNSDRVPSRARTPIARSARADRVPSQPEVRFFVTPANKLPFDIFDADLVFMVHVLGEIPDRLAALREAERVLRPGGVLSVSEALLDPHYRFRNDVVRMAEHAGFEHLSTEGSLFSYTATFRKPMPKEPLGYVPRFE